MNKKVIIVLTIIYLIMLCLNFLTPLYYGDDIVYAFIWHNQYINIPLPENIERISCLMDIVISQWRHYYTNNGRAVAHFFVQFFIWQGKFLFNFVNSLVFLLLILQIHWISDRGTVSFNNLKVCNICLIFFILWSLIADFWCVYLWLAGACNYLWSIVILLFFLMPYEHKFFFVESCILKKLQSEKYCLCFFLLGICAGQGNENTICWIILVLVFWLYRLFNLKQIENWMVYGFAGLCIGYTLLIFAPGNVVRMNYYLANYFMNKWEAIYSIGLLKARLYNLGMIEYLQIPLWYFILVSLRKIKNAVFHERSHEITAKKYYILTILCGVLSLLFNIIMLLAPDFPLRSGFASLVFITIAASLITRARQFTGKKVTATYKKSLSFISSVIFILSMFGRFYDCIQFYKYDSEVKRIVQYQKQMHVQSVLEISEFKQVPIVLNWSSDLPLEQLNLSKNENNWRNVAFSRYYNIKAIRTIKTVVE